MSIGFSVTVECIAFIMTSFTIIKTTIHCLFQKRVTNVLKLKFSYLFSKSCKVGFCKKQRISLTLLLQLMLYSLRFVLFLGKYCFDALFGYNVMKPCRITIPLIQLNVLQLLPLKLTSPLVFETPPMSAETLH